MRILSPNLLNFRVNVFNQENNQPVVAVDYFPENTTFKSTGTGLIGKALVSFFETMNNSLAASFLILDAFGMVLPRVWQAYNRNSKELGHKNSAAAIEEFFREALTGPSIVFMPILVSLGYARLAGKSIETPKHLLEEYKDITHDMLNNKRFRKKLNQDLNVVKQNVNNTEAIARLQKSLSQKFYLEVFQRALPPDFKNKKELIDKLQTDLFKESKLNIDHARHIVSNHNKIYGTFPERPFSIYFPSKLSDKLVDGDVAKLLTTSKNYVLDVVNKVSLYWDHPEAGQMVERLQSKIISGRILTALGGIAAVALALRAIPIWYSSMHKVFPGLYGLGSYQYQEQLSINGGEKL